LAIGIRGLVIGLLVRAVLNQLFQAKTFGRRFGGLWGSLPWRKLAVMAATPLTLLLLGLTLVNEPGFVWAAAVAGLSGLATAVVLLKSGLIERPGDPIPIEESSASPQDH
jgi:hypothetical protein